MKGKLIQISSRLKKEHRAEIESLTEEYQESCKRNKCEHTQSSWQKLEADRLKLNLALTTEAEKHLRWTGTKFYLQKE